MKKITSLLALLAVGYLNAQVTSDETKAKTEAAINTLTKTKTIKEGWTKGGIVNINLNESGRNDYWIKGGEKINIGVKGLVDYDFDNKKGAFTWLNSVRARYGVNRATSSGNKFLKNDDYFNFTSIAGKEFKKQWSYIVFGSVESQFSKYFMSPGYIKLGPGVMYRPNEHFSLLFSPLMAGINTKFSPKHKIYDLFGVKANKIAAFTLGAFAQAKMNYDLAKGVNYKSVTTLYSNYLNKPGNMVYDMTNLFTFTVNKYIGTTFSLNLRYNDFEVKHFQTQHGLGIGLSYKL